MIEIETAIARLTGNSWEVYLGEPPRDWLAMAGVILDDGRRLAEYLEPLLPLIAAVRETGVAKAAAYAEMIVPCEDIATVQRLFDAWYKTTNAYHATSDALSARILGTP